MMELQMQVAQAVQVLNHDVQSCNRVAANQWLVHFQHSDAAWEVATGILNSELPYLQQDYDVQLFAAQILKRKIQGEGVALQAEYRAALQAALLSSAKRCSNGPPQLLTQICLALSALVLRAVELKKPIEQMFSSLYELQGQGVGSNAILELLTVLPEEVIEDNTVNLTVDSARRWNFTQEILSHTAVVLEFLLQQSKEESTIAPESYDRRKKVLRSLLSWVRVGCFLEIPQANIASHPVLGFVYDSLQVPTLFDLSVEVLIELVNRHESLPHLLLQKMQFFKEALLMPAIASKNERVISSMSCLLSEIGQMAPSLVAEGSHEAFMLTDALLSCVAYQDQDWEIADSTVNFWCTLAEFILGLGSDVSQKKITLETFAPIYTVLLDAILLRAQVDESDLDDYNRNRSLPDGLARFRRNLEELFTNICYMLGPAQFLSKVLNGSWITLESSVHWKLVEVRLFCLNTVSEVVLEDDKQFDLSVIMQLIMTIQKIPVESAPTMMQLVYKALAEVVGSYAKTLCPTTAAVQPVLSFLASGLQIPAAASSSATALRKLCEEVSFISNEAGNLEGLLWIGESVHRMGLLAREDEDIVCAIGSILSTIQNGELLDISLKRVLKPSYGAIETLVQSKANCNGSSEEHASADMVILDAAVRAVTRLGLIVSQLSLRGKQNHSGQDPVLEVLRYFWPLLEAVLVSSHMENNPLAAAVCRALSSIIRISDQQFFALLPNAMGALCHNFASVQSNECFIRTATVVLEQFGHRNELASLFVSTFNAFTESEIIATMNSPYACDQEPDVVEAYMSFTSMFLCCCSKDTIITAGSLVETSFKKATIWCTAMHRGAAIAALSYMSRFLELGTTSLLESGAHINDFSVASMCIKVCSECGESIISGVLYALLGVSAMTRVHKSATVLQQLAAVCHLSELTNWSSKFGWNSLQTCVMNAVHALPAEYLKSGESEQLISSWLNALQFASTDYCNSKLSSLAKGVGSCNTQSDGGRTLKRLIREFADVHRLTAPNFVSM